MDQIPPHHHPESVSCWGWRFFRVVSTRNTVCVLGVLSACGSWDHKTCESSTAMPLFGLSAHFSTLLHSTVCVCVCVFSVFWSLYRSFYNPGVIFTALDTILDMITFKPFQRQGSRDVWRLGCLVQHFSPDWISLKTLRWIAVKFGAGMCSPQTINHNDLVIFLQCYQQVKVYTHISVLAWWIGTSFRFLRGCILMTFPAMP